MKQPDTWLTRLRALTGVGVLGWELVTQHGQQWWPLVLAAWLLGAPLEELIRFLTAGRLQIQAKREDDDE